MEIVSPQLHFLSDLAGMPRTHKSLKANWSFPPRPFTKFQGSFITNSTCFNACTQKRTTSILKFRKEKEHKYAYILNVCGKDVIDDTLSGSNKGLAEDVAC